MGRYDLGKSSEAERNMTERELKRLSRGELVELLLEETRRSEALAQQLQKTEAALADRRIQIEKSGTLAEAALNVSGVLEAADKAARLYLENLQFSDGGDRQARMLKDTEAHCREMVDRAKKDAQGYIGLVMNKLKKLAEQDPALEQALIRVAQKETKQ